MAGELFARCMVSACSTDDIVLTLVGAGGYFFINNDDRLRVDLVVEHYPPTFAGVSRSSSWFQPVRKLS